MASAPRPVDTASTGGSAAGSARPVGSSRRRLGRLGRRPVRSVGASAGSTRRGDCSVRCGGRLGRLGVRTTVRSRPDRLIRSGPGVGRPAGRRWASAAPPRSPSRAGVTRSQAMSSGHRRGQHTCSHGPLSSLRFVGLIRPEDRRADPAAPAPPRSAVSWTGDRRSAPPRRRPVASVNRHRQRGDRDSPSDAATAPSAVPLIAPRDGTPAPTEDAAGLARAISALSGARGPVAIDAERASGYRYSSRAYLVQLRRGDSGTVLLDPLPFGDLSGLAAAIADEEWVLHAASQDLPCLSEIGLRPTRLFDTELAARLAGYERVGLAALTESLLGLLAGEAPLGGRLVDPAAAGVVAHVRGARRRAARRPAESAGRRIGSAGQDRVGGRGVRVAGDARRRAAPRTAGSVAPYVRDPPGTGRSRAVPGAGDVVRPRHRRVPPRYRARPSARRCRPDRRGRDGPSGRAGAAAAARLRRPIRTPPGHHLAERAGRGARAAERSVAGAGRERRATAGAPMGGA